MSVIVAMSSSDSPLPGMKPNATALTWTPITRSGARLAINGPMKEP